MRRRSASRTPLVESGATGGTMSWMANTRAVWTVKGGHHGEREDRLLANNLIGGGWEELPSLEGVGEREQLAERYAAAYPDASPSTRANYVGQLWSLLRRMQVGELVVLPLKTSGTIAVGRISGPISFVTTWART